MIKFLRGLGMTSDVAYLAGMLSIGASIAAWTASSRMKDAPGDKADRWGIYVGLWAPPSWLSATPSRWTKAAERHREHARHAVTVPAACVLPDRD